MDQCFGFATTLSRYGHFHKSLILIYGTTAHSYFAFTVWLSEKNQRQCVDGVKDEKGFLLDSLKADFFLNKMIAMHHFNEVLVIEIHFNKLD